MLTKQLQVKDEVWLNILDCLQIGECTESDLREIRKLIVNKHLKAVTDFTKDPWKDAILITPRHTICDHCGTVQQQENTCICGAEDTDGANNSELLTEVRFEIAQLVEKQTGNLQDRTTVLIGMKAMVVIDVATEADTLSTGQAGPGPALFCWPSTLAPQGWANLSWPIF